MGGGKSKNEPKSGVDMAMKKILRKGNGPGGMMDEINEKKNWTREKKKQKKKRGTSTQGNKHTRKINHRTKSPEETKQTNDWRKHQNRGRGGKKVRGKQRGGFHRETLG